MPFFSEDKFNRQLSSGKGYRFQHSWELKAPVETVWNVVSEPENWSTIFYGFSIQQDPEEAPSLSEDACYSFQIKGSLPYTLSLKVDILKFLSKELMLVKMGGDLKGIGKFETCRYGDRTKINFKMNVVPVKFWMRLVAPIAGKFFVKNHNLIVDKSYQSLSNRVAMELG